VKSKRAGQKTLPPIKVGNVSISRCIYADGRLAIWYPWKDNPRKVQTFVNHKKGNAEAERIARELHNGGAEAQIFTSADRADYSQARKDVAPFGIAVHVATASWSEEEKQIRAGGFSRAAVIEAGLESLLRTPHLVPDVAVEFINSKETDQNLDRRYKRGIRSTWELMASRFKCDIREVTAHQLETLLDGEIDAATRQRIGGLRKSNGELLGLRRRDNILDEIRQGFQFARLRKYLPDEISAARQVPMRYKQGGPISYFTIVEMRLILEHVAEEWLPFVVLACFCGPRTGELALSKDAKQSKDPLRWDDFDFDEREILMRDVTSKVGRPRTIPILDNAFEWLVPHRRETGYVVPKGLRPDREFGKGARLERAINAALKKAPLLANERPVQLQMAGIAEEPLPLLTEFAWRNNALRHSYGSYRMGILGDLQKLSAEMGNSPAICARHYNNPRPKSQARAWFSIFPKKHATIVPFPVAKTA